MHILPSTPSVAPCGLCTDLRAMRQDPVHPEGQDDQVTISAGAQQLLNRTETAAQEEASDEEEASDRTERSALAQTSGTVQELDPGEQRVVAELRQRDREVRTHERAHLMAAGSHAKGGPRFTYQIGPDGRRYAVAGAVPIDLSPVPGNPRATLQKAAMIRRAAVAPAHPSSADLAVAASAAAMMAQARQELRETQNTPRTTEPAASPLGPTHTTSGTESTIQTTDETGKHVCGPHCQSHGANPNLSEPSAAARDVTLRATSVLQSYLQPAPPASLLNVRA